MLSDYQRYLLKLKNSLIRCGVELKSEDLSDYSDLFNFGEKLNDLLWFYSMLDISGSDNKLRGFMLPLNSYYNSNLRDKYFEDYLLYKEDYMSISVSGMLMRERLQDVEDEEIEEPYEEEEVTWDFGGSYFDNSALVPSIEEVNTEGHNSDALEEEFSNWGTSSEEEDFVVESEDDFIVQSTEEVSSPTIEEKSLKKPNILRIEPFGDDDGFIIYGDSDENEDDEFVNWVESSESEEDDEFVNWGSQGEEMNDFEDDEFVNWGSSECSEGEEDSFESWGNSDIDEEDDEFINWGSDSSSEEDEDDSFGNWGSNEEEEDDSFGSWGSSQDEEVEEDSFGNWGSSDNEDEESDFSNWGSEDEEDEDSFGSWGSSEDEEDSFGNWGSSEDENIEEEEYEDKAFGSWGSSDDDDYLNDSADDEYDDDDAFGSWGSSDETSTDSDDLDGTMVGGRGNTSSTSSISRSNANGTNSSKTKSKLEYEIESNEKTAKVIEKIASGIFSKGGLLKNKVSEKFRNLEN